MTAIAIVIARSYLSLNLALSLFAIVLVLLSFSFRRFHLEVENSSKLKVIYFTLTLVLAVIFGTSVCPISLKNFNSVEVWAAPSRASLDISGESATHAAYIEFPGPERRGMTFTQPFLRLVQLVVMVFAIFAFLIGLFFISREISEVRRLLRSLYVIRRIGRVQIAVSDDVQIPFSIWLPFRSLVVLPSQTFSNDVIRSRNNTFVTKKSQSTIAILHELQHHRQGDTKWAYVFCILTSLCAMNPMIRLLREIIFEIQEYACDETLVDLKKVDSQDYASCLFEMAKTALRKPQHFECTARSSLFAGRKQLIRRIDRMLFPRKKSRPALTWSIAAFLPSVLVASALASNGLVIDRRVSSAQAQVLLANAARSSDFPVVVNQSVLKQLNYYIATPEGRDKMRGVLARMEALRPTLERFQREYQVPTELLAIPMTESGYENLPDRNQHGWGAGLWMFIASTARNFGLHVDTAGVDERLNVEKETDAAMRYLLANKLRFGDWSLAILAYNAGEQAVDQAIAKYHTRNAWELINHGFENDKDYLAKVMSSVLIMKNPDVLK